MMFSKLLIFSTFYFISNLLDGSIVFAHQQEQSINNRPNHLPIFELRRVARHAKSSAAPLTLSQVIAHPDLFLQQARSTIKRKKNLSDLVQSLILVDEDVKEIFTTTSRPTEPPTKANGRSIYSSNDFCYTRPDGLYDDPFNCAKFIICYIHQTFRTKCADGTKWNHHTKECDYPELVDCARGTTTTTTTKTTSTTTLKASPKVSETKTTIATTTEAPISLADRFKIKFNILLTIILVPSCLLLLIIIVFILWLLKNKIEKDSKKNHQKTKEIEALENQSKSRQSFSSFVTQSAEKYSCCCCCRTSKKNLPSLEKSSFNTTNQKTVKTDVSKLNFTDSSLSPNKNMPYSIIKNYNYINKLIDEGCEVVNSRATLSSHFEDNNWDYNFAMRGLYLTQPWVKGNYINTTGNFGSVNTLQSINEDVYQNSDESVVGDSDEKEGVGKDDKKKSQDHGGSDTDGFYA